MNKILIIFAVLLTCASTGYSAGFKCYECSFPADVKCNDTFKVDDGLLKENCLSCGKKRETDNTGKITLVTRTCESTAAKVECKPSTGTGGITTELCSCATEKCNTAVSVRAALGPGVILVVMNFFVRMWN